MLAWFARHQTAANLLMLAIMVLGAVALPGLQRATFPEIENDRVQVRVIYPGATPAEVEDAICRRIEDALDGVTGLEELRCEAREGAGTATAVKQEGVQMTRFLDDISTAVDAVADFPAQTERPLVEELGLTDRVISVAVTGPDDPISLKAYAESLKSRMQRLDSVAKVTVSGFSDHQIRIEIPASRLQQYGVSLNDVAAAVQRNSVSTPAGALEGGREDLVLRVDDQRKTVAEMRDIVVISGSSGAAITLGEIATISNRFERDESKILFNGKRAAILNVEKTSAQDVLVAYHSVVDFVAAERKRAPQGVTLTLTQDVASVVQDRLDMLVANGIQGLLLVFLMLWLFFSFRYSFWVTMGLPVSFLGALFVLPVLGITINMISMVGLLIGIGLLMDDAIVIAENVAARMAKGDHPLEAAVNGVGEVLPGILSSFATTLLVFGSLAFISGELGQILRVLPIVLIIVISVSLVEAFCVLPSHLGHSLAHMKHREPSAFRQRFEALFDRLRDGGFGPWLDRAVEYRYLTLGLVLMLLLFSVAMPVGGMLKFVGFPQIDGDIVEARVLLPQGTPLQRTEAVVARLTRVAESLNERFTPDQPDGQPLVRNVIVIFGENPDSYESGPHVARVVVDLLSAEIRNTRLDDFRNSWRNETGELPDVISIKYTESAIGPGGRAIDVRLLGVEPALLKAASQELQDWFNQYAGVLDVSDDLRPGKREFRLHLKPAARTLGLSALQLGDQLRAAYQGIVVDEYPLGPETYEVELRLAAADRRSPADLERMTLVDPKGNLIPLSVVAEIEEVRGWARIHRINGAPAVTVQGDVDVAVANAQELMRLAAQSILPQLRERYPGLQVDVEGQSSESAETGLSIVRNVLLGLFGVYLLLALQFRGYLAPLTVMVVIPTALIGVIFGHLLMGLDLTMPSIVGMASLFGVVVNDSILLVVFIRQEVNAGMAVEAAAKQAGRARFRPIMLTSLTTVAGLLPLLAERSLQAQILIPLAASLAFGLAVATIAALFLVPAVYCILNDFNLLGALHEELDEVEAPPAAAVEEPTSTT